MKFSSNTGTSTLTMVFGPMFSGKSTYTRNLISKYQSINKKTFLVSHESEKIRNNGRFKTHNQKYVDSCNFASTDGLEKSLNCNEFREADLVVIEEAQFFNSLHSTMRYLLKNTTKDYLTVGLSGDYRQKKMGEFLELIPLADKVEHLTAFCGKCKNNDAPFTKRLIGGAKYGGVNDYIPLCRKCLNE